MNVYLGYSAALGEIDWRNLAYLIFVVNSIAMGLLMGLVTAEGDAVVNSLKKECEGFSVGTRTVHSTPSTPILHYPGPSFTRRRFKGASHHQYLNRPS